MTIDLKTATYRISPYGNVSINANATFTKSTEVILNLFGKDNIGVIGYYVSTSNIIPLITDTNWINITPIKTYIANVPYTLSSGDGVKTVYVWYKDTSGNISLSSSASIILDTLIPIISVVETTNSVITYGAVIAGNDDWVVSSISIVLGNNRATIVPIDIVNKTDKALINISYVPKNK